MRVLHGHPPLFELMATTGASEALHAVPGERPLARGVDRRGPYAGAAVTEAAPLAVGQALGRRRSRDPGDPDDRERGEPRRAAQSGGLAAQ